MPEISVFSDRLDSWKEIASYINRSVRTVIRWEAQKGLPIHRIPGGERHSVFAYKKEIDLWMHNGGSTSAGELSIRTSLPPLIEPLDVPSDPHPGPPAVVLELEPRSQADTSARLWPRLAVGIVASAALVAAILFTLRWLFPSGLQNDEQSVISDEGIPAFGPLLAAGGNLYLGVFRNGRVALAIMPETGGPVREIPTPFLEVQPVALAADGNSVLVLVGDGMAREQPLWEISLRTGEQTRIGQFLCHAAALSPDGSMIAYAFGTSIYLAADHGSSTYPIHTFNGVPQVLRWSLDGRRLVALVRDSAEDSVVWKLVLGKEEHYFLDSLIPVTRNTRRYDSMSPVIDDQDELFLAETDAPVPTIFSLRHQWFPLKSPYRAEAFVKKSHVGGELALDRQSSRLFYFKNALEQDELNRLDPKTGEILPFLPGISAHDVAFSRDRRSIAYVTDPKNPISTLWIAGSDGSAPRQINTDGMTALELPQWSPDGKVLAFMGRYPDRPWRIYLVAGAGSKPQEVSRGSDNQGAPTWSPDGKSLVYGRVLCQETKTCAIVTIDVKTRDESVIPGSEGLTTARWSPNGSYIAALRPEKEQVVLLDRSNGEWRTLTDGVNGDDLAWSWDSRVVYASNPHRDKPEILRISLSGHPQDPIDLSAYGHLSGRVDTWFAVASDGSIVFTRLVHEVEIVAAHYTNK